MSGMFKNPETQIPEEHLSAFFTNPPNPFSGEAPPVETLVADVLAELALLECTKNMPFEVPRHYWETPLATPQPQPQRLSATRISLLQAACIISFLCIGFLPIYHKNQLNGNDIPINNTISVEDAQWYLDNNTMSNDMAWLEWEDKLLNDDTEHSLNLFNDLLPEDIKNFF